MTTASLSLAGTSRPWRPISVAALVRASVALTVASGAIVFTEPAPYDVLMLGLIGLLTLTGLQRYTHLLGLYLVLWLACVAGASIATMASAELARSATHSAVSLYLSLSSFALAAFVARAPRETSALIMRAYVAAALLAATAGIAGYFDALPGAFEQLTKFGRASGTFKDPNVFGAFLVPAILYLAHLLLTRPAARTVFPLTGLIVLASAVLLSFSRGAWFNLAAALIVYGYLRFITASSNRLRLRLAHLGMLAILLTAAAVTAALQIDAVGSLFAERAELAQDYDVGPDGRFGGQEKAASLALAHPAGIGALQFASLYHHEDVHNVYVSMFLNAGWLGGLLYLCIIGLSIGLGFAHALRPSAHRGIFLVAYAALLGCVIEGTVIDTDHWRHFYLLLALVWGMMAGDSAPHSARNPP